MSPDNVSLTLQSQTKPQYALPSDNWQLHGNENNGANVSSNCSFTKNYVGDDTNKSEGLSVYSLHNAYTSDKNDNSYSTNCNRNNLNINNSSYSNNNDNKFLSNSNVQSFSSSNAISVYNWQ